MTAYWLGKQLSDETKRKLSESHKGKALSEDQKQKISEANKGKHSGKRKPLSEETKKRMSESHKGKRLSEETKRKISESHKGKGKSAEHKQHIGESSKGRTPWNKGKTLGAMSFEERRKHSESVKGEKHYNWQGGKTKAAMKVRRSFETRIWRESVFARDNFTCQECGERGVYLHAHHIQSFAAHPYLRFDIANGITLCKHCHEKTPNYKGRKALND